MANIIIKDDSDGILDEALGVLPGILGQANQLVNSNKQVELAKQAQANADKKMDMQVAEYEYNVKTRKEQEDMKDLLWNTTNITHPSNAMVASGKGPEYDWNQAFGSELPDYFTARQSYIEGARAKGITPNMQMFDQDWSSNQQAYFSKELQSFNSLYDHYKAKGWDNNQIYKELKINHNADKMRSKYNKVFGMLPIEQRPTLQYPLLESVSGKGRVEGLIDSAEKLVWDEQAGEMTWPAMIGTGLMAIPAAMLAKYTGGKILSVPKALRGYFKNKNGVAELSEKGVKLANEQMGKTSSKLVKETAGTALKGKIGPEPAAFKPTKEMLRVNSKLDDILAKVRGVVKDKGLLSPEKMDWDQWWKTSAESAKNPKVAEALRKKIAQFNPAEMAKVGTKAKESFGNRWMRRGAAFLPFAAGMELGGKGVEMMGGGELSQTAGGLAGGAGVTSLLKNINSPKVKRAILKVGGKSLYKKMLLATGATLAPEGFSTMAGVAGLGLMAKDIAQILSILNSPEE
tara:strand:- start:1590 stop:3137 length:1548 start_codon:yes stop_codon:yes gene_type:complete